MSTRAAIEARIQQEACRRYFRFFVQQVAFPIAAPGDYFISNWHIEAIAHALERVARGEIKRLIITLPPRSLKSICASVAFPAWLLGLDPTQRIIVASYSEALARNFSTDCRRVMASQLYREIFPGTRLSATKDTETEFRTLAGGYRLAASVGGTLTGRGGSTVILDDPMKAGDADSEAARDGLKRWYTNTLLSRLDNKGEDCIVVVSQRLHEDDLVGFLLKQDGWEHLDLPAIADTDDDIPLGQGRSHHRSVGDILHPAREGKEVLDDLRRHMGSGAFSAQYLQRPVPEGGDMLKWPWFARHEVPPVPSSGDRIIISWDTAMNATELSGYSVGLVLLVRGETVFVLDVIREQLEYPELRRKVIQTHEKWRHAAGKYELVIEDKGSGMALIQDLKGSNIHAIAINPVGDKIMRMNAHTARIESGAVSLPRFARWLDDFKHEICAFPNSRHKDQVDALSQGLDRAFKPHAKVTVVSVLGHY